MATSQRVIGNKVFFDFSTESGFIGKIVVGVYTKDAPRASKNFLQLCEGSMVNGTHIRFKNTPISRIVPGQYIQAGDIDGNGGQSIYGMPFPDDVIKVPFDRPYQLSMANKGPGTNTSEFFITTSPCHWFSSDHTVFGEIVSGEDVLHTIEQYGSSTGQMAQAIYISDCGVLS